MGYEYVAEVSLNASQIERIKPIFLDNGFELADPLTKKRLHLLKGASLAKEEIFIDFDSQRILITFHTYTYSQRSEFLNIATQSIRDISGCNVDFNEAE